MLTPLMQIHKGIAKLRTDNGLDNLSITIESGNGKVSNASDEMTSIILCGHVVYGGRNCVSSFRVFTDEAIACNSDIISLQVREMKKSINRKIKEKDEGEDGH